MVSIYWNVNSHNRYHYAVDGRIVTTFGMSFPEYRGGSDPDRLLNHMLELPFSRKNSYASAFALAELITWVRLERSWIEARHRVVAVTPLPREPHPDLKPEHTELAAHHPEVAAPIRNASMKTLPRIALLAAERAAAETGIGNDPVIRAALEALRSGAHDLATHRADLVPVVQRLERNQLDAPQATVVGDMAGSRHFIFDPGRERRLEAFRRVHAGYAARNALWPDPLIAALQAVNDASHAVSDKGGLFRDVISLVTEYS
jgi:hypothetical protein